MTYLVESLSFVSVYSYKLISWFDEYVTELKRVRDINRTIKELSKLSDKELKDIGIIRGNIYEVAHKAYPENHNLKGWV